MVFKTNSSKYEKKVVTLLFMNHFSRNIIKISYDKTRKHSCRGPSPKGDQPYRALRIWFMKKEKKRERTFVQSQRKTEWLRHNPTCTWPCCLALDGICRHAASYQQITLADCDGAPRHPKLPGHAWQEQEVTEFVTQHLPLFIPGWR